MKACSIGLHNLVKKTLDNKPYFSYKENDNFGTITILDSYTKKINIKNSMGIAGTVATSINTAINNGYKNIGKVAFIGRDIYNRGIVNIKATDNQLNLINAIDNSKEADELQKEVDKEREIEEERALRESRSQEIEENREYFENDEPFTRASVDEKPIPGTGIQGTLFQETGRSLQELDNLPEKEIENLQSTVEYQILNEQEEEDLTIKGGQSYVFLNKRDAERFSVLLNREGEFPKEFRVEKKVTRYKKDSEVKGKFNAFNEYEDYYYSKVNNNKKSNLYNITNEKTGDVIAENVRVLHVSKDVKKSISEKYGLEFTPTKVFSANRSIGFTLYRLKPSKNKYVAQAKKYLYDALKFLNPEETNLKINLEKIEKFLESFPKDMWDYINTTYSPEDSTNINASISLQNKIKFELPKLGFLQEIEKITGIPLQGVSFRNYDRSGWIEKKLKYGWKEVVTIDHTLFSADKLRGLIAYYLNSKGYFKPSSEEENIRKYAEHTGTTVDFLMKTVFSDEYWDSVEDRSGWEENKLSNNAFNKAFGKEGVKPDINIEDIKNTEASKEKDDIVYNQSMYSNTMAASKMRESIRKYDWQSVELFEKPYENFQNTVKERITKKFKDKTLSNGISHLDYFFSGNFNWLNINFNNISGQYYMSDMETEADTGFDVKMVGFANPFELKTYKKPKPGKNFLEEKEVFNRLAAILHEPFHALHALSYGTEEELQLRKAFDNLYNTNFGREMMSQVFGSGYNQGQQISYDTLYKEFTAFATQLMLYPKEWITKTDLRSNDIYDFIQKVQTLQDKTYEEIVRTQQKIGTTEKTITEEEQIKLTFLEKLYNYLVSALNKIIPLSKKFFDVIADSKLVEKTVIEDVFGETEETVTKTLKLPENIKKAKEEFLSSMEDLKSAINTLMQIDSKLFSPDNINKFFNKDQFNQEPGRAEEPNIKPGVKELFNSNPELSSIGTPEQYSQYLDTIFPDSEVKNIVYHTTNDKFDKFKVGNVGYLGKGIYFFWNNIGKDVYNISAVINTINPEIIYDYLEQKNIQKDSILHPDELVVFEPEQIHILGNKEDIEGFKKFVSESTQTVESYRAQEQAELSQRIPNIENYKVDGKVVKSLITDENDLETYNEIYDKYDALITPLLEASEETKEQPEDILKTYEEDLEQNTEDLEDTEDTSNINEDDDFLEEDFPVEEKENKPDVKYTFNEEFELLNRKLISLGLNTLSLEDYDNFTNIQKEIIKSCYGI
jgi:hypothetical protein